MKSELTRRGFIAMAAAAPVVFKPRSSGLTQMLNEIDPMHQVMYAYSVGTGWMTEYWPKRHTTKSPYWHGMPPVVAVDLMMPWEK